MFNKPFELRTITSQQRNLGGGNFLIENTFSFWGNPHGINQKRKRYIAIVEQYNYEVYVIKFCLQERKFYNDRFNVLTKLNECGRVLGTMGELVQQIF